MSTTSTSSSAPRAGGDASNHHRRFVGSREQARREAVAPLDLAEEGLAVLGVANGARRDGERPLGAERLELAAVVGEAVPDACDGHGQQSATAVDSFAQPRDREAPNDLLELVRPRRRRRGDGWSSSRGRPLRRGSSSRQERAQPTRPALCPLERREQYLHPRARESQTLERQLQVLARASRPRRGVARFAPHAPRTARARS